VGCITWERIFASKENVKKAIRKISKFLWYPSTIYFLLKENHSKKKFYPIRVRVFFSVGERIGGEFSMGTSKIITAEFNHFSMTKIFAYDGL
jgi:hypothetical protein